MPLGLALGRLLVSSRNEREDRLRDRIVGPREIPDDGKMALALWVQNLHRHPGVAEVPRPPVGLALIDEFIGLRVNH